MEETARSAGGDSRRGFWSLFATQFQGAFSDNAFKNLVIFLLIGWGVSQDERDTLASVVTLLFAVPFILFAMSGGFLADRYSKRTVTIGTKIMEIGTMLLAVAGLALQNMYFLFGVVFLMSTQSALFGPSKYGLLPELLPRKRLSWGNGIIEMGTNLAVISGMVAGAIMADIQPNRQAYSGAMLVALACMGLLASFGITRVPAADPARKYTFNILGDVWNQLRIVRKDRVLFLAIIGSAYFTFFAALLLILIPIFSADTLGIEDNVPKGILMAAAALGIGAGSVTAGFLSGNKIEYGLIPIGAVGITLSGAAMSYPELGVRALEWFGVSAGFVQAYASDITYYYVMGLLVLLGFSSGFFAVPVASIVQHRPPEGQRGRVIATSAFISWLGVALASGVYFVLSVRFKLAPPQVFLVAAILTAIGTALAVYLLPRSLVRLLGWFLTHTLYRIRVEGRDNIPEKGGALFVCNHMSFVDVALLLASTDRSIRFMMFKEYYEHPAIHPLAKLMGAIPVASTQRPREMIRSLQAASDIIRGGGVVGIFAEGEITRIGNLLPFRRGFERIMKDVDAPIIPVNLEGVWGSIFSFASGRFLWKLPRRIPYPVTVSYGEPLPPNATAAEVRNAVQELQAGAFVHRRAQMRPIHREFIRTARRHPRRVAMADATTPRVRFGEALVKAVFLARRLRSVWEGQKMVGLLLPPTVPGALVNFAALLLGKVPVNLNYTASDSVIASSVEQCGITTVITSRAFLEKVSLQVPGQAVYLEDVAANPRLTEKIVALLLGRFAPMRLLERALGVSRKIKLDDLATVIFSSGSTGDPKGVMLSHYNILSNARQIGQVIPLDSDDRMLGILPFFHSFGFTATLIFPAVTGIGAVYHPNPLDPRAIGELVRKHAVTFLMATPTFLQGYTRRIESGDFGSLKFVLVGAEKLPDRISLAFEDKFGIRPLEGYGCTECAPVVAVNTRDFRAAGFRQVGAKRGTIGHPMPGISIRIVDPDSREPLPPGEPGLMLVRGPNVMQGYLGNPEKTAEVLRDGWYDTGDIASLDEDGFITITDRLSRFSKIGGEMVPHIKIEERLHEAAEATEQCFAVTGVPDAKKGERLIVLHTLTEEQARQAQDRLSDSGLPNLWVPRGNQYFHIETIPMLGTGKLDLRSVRALATELSGADQAAK